MINKCNLVELFSGIGSQAKALKNLGININTLGTCEWDVHAIAAYDIIHSSSTISDEILGMTKTDILKMLKKYTFSNSGKAPLDYSALRTYSLEALQRICASVIRNRNYVDINALKGENLPDNIDILTYSFPCQDLSNVGSFHGYNKGIDKDSGSRSSLLWQVGRILTEMNEYGKKLPRFLLMENVPTLLSKRHSDNFHIWIKDLKELGYTSKYFQLNASLFGLPQNRPRLLMISVQVGGDKQASTLVENYFNEKDESKIVDDYQQSPFFYEYQVCDFLRLNYSNREIMNEAIECTPNDTISRKRIWENNPQIVLPGNVINESIDCVRTITTKQDRHPNSGNIYFESGIEGRSNFRYLTPRECLLFMGFTDEDYRNLKNNNIEFHKGDAFFARDKVIRMAGNSIPVKLLEGIFLQILQIDALLNSYKMQTDKKYIYRTMKGMAERQIKQYLFSRGIRSRISAFDYPVCADITYPKYKTALFIQNCFCDLEIHQNSSATPEVSCFLKRNSSSFDVERLRYKEVIQKGWNAIVVRRCDILGEFSQEYLSALYGIISRNIVSEKETGEVIVLDRQIDERSTQQEYQVI